MANRNGVFEARYCCSFGIEYNKIIDFEIRVYIQYTHAANRNQTQMCDRYSGNIENWSQSEESSKAAIDSSDYR